MSPHSIAKKNTEYYVYKLFLLFTCSNKHVFRCAVLAW